MKKHVEGKSERSGRTSSQSLAIDSTPKFHVQSRKKKRISRKSTGRISRECMDELPKIECPGFDPAKEKIPETDESKEETTIENAKNEETSADEIIPDRPESPPNPYNKYEYKAPVQWPGEENREPSLVNSVESLECGDYTKSLIGTCSCCPTDQHNDGCCKADAVRKALYHEIKARVERAVERHKIFLIRGDLPKLATSLEKRGWVQKYESVRTRMVPYGSVASLDSKSVGSIKNSDGTINERALVFALLRHKPPDFIWDRRNDFIDWDSSLGSHVILNRLQRSYVYTSKLGMSHILQEFHWLYEANVADVRYPRSYNVSREANDFLTDYRINAATGLLKWFVERVEKGEAFVDLGIEPIPISQLEFAVERCEEFFAETRDQNIDDETNPEKSISDDRWNCFLDDYSRVLHQGNGIAAPRNSEAQCRFEKCYLTATETLKKMKGIDSQYELNGMRNIWILKPSELCCGAGISISHNLKDILRRVEAKPKDYFVVQKYIEKPLLIKDTKFDIRLWYLVTNTYPLTIWLFEEALLRFSSKPYTFTTYHEAIHICNTAVQQKYAYENSRRLRRRNNQMGSTNDKTNTTMVESIRDQEWDCLKLNEYLKTVGYKGEPYNDEIYPKMSQAIVLTMLASQEYMDKRRCSFELYGADFMVMDDLSVWLIEINTNPRMNPPSSRLTQRLYDGVLESLVKESWNDFEFAFIRDWYRNSDEERKFRREIEKWGLAFIEVTMDLPLDATAETGGFRLAYRQNAPTNFQPYLGPCLFVIGTRMKLHENRGDEASKMDRERGSSFCNPWKKQDRARTAPPSMPRSRDPKVVDFIDYLNSSRCTVAR